jgi:hypothetical protein
VICSRIEACYCSTTDQSRSLLGHPSTSGWSWNFYVATCHHHVAAVALGSLEAVSCARTVVSMKDDSMGTIVGHYYFGNDSHHLFHKSFLWSNSETFGVCSVDWLRIETGMQKSLDVVRWGSLHQKCSRYLPTLQL